MTIDFSQVLLDHNGKPFPDADAPESVWTLGKVCETAVMNDCKDASGEAKYEDWNLISKIRGASVVDVTVKEILRFKTAVGKVYPTAFVGPAWNLLEGK